MDNEKLKSLLRETIISTFEELTNPFHIIVLFDNSEKRKLELPTEGKWIPSKKKDYWQRLGKSKFDFEFHVHIARQKHINIVHEKVCWIKDSTRHDKETFNTNLIGLETAKKIAQEAIVIPPRIILENISNDSGLILLETVEYLPMSTSIFIFKAIKNKPKKSL